MDVPDWWSFVLLAAAAWRVFQLIAHDDILDRPRRWALRLGNEWEREGDRVPEGFREHWSLFIQCPYCAGFWIAVVWWLAWQADGFWTEVAATPWALSAGVIALAKVLTSEE